MSFRILILPVLALQLAWSQQLVPSDARASQPPSASGQPATATTDELVDPFEGLGEMSDNAQKEWEKVVAEETPKVQQTCVAVRIHASVGKMLAARAKYDTANKNYLEATGRYATDSSQFAFEAESGRISEARWSEGGPETCGGSGRGEEERES